MGNCSTRCGASTSIRRRPYHGRTHPCRAWRRRLYRLSIRSRATRSSPLHNQKQAARNRVHHLISSMVSGSTPTDLDASPEPLMQITSTTRVSAYSRENSDAIIVQLERRLPADSRLEITFTVRLRRRGRFNTLPDCLRMLRAITNPGPVLEFNNDVRSEIRWMARLEAMREGSTRRRSRANVRRPLAHRDS